MVLFNNDGDNHSFPPFFSNVIQVLQTRAISKRVVSSQNNINCKLFVVTVLNIPNLGMGSTVYGEICRRAISNRKY